MESHAIFETIEGVACNGNMMPIKKYCLARKGHGIKLLHNKTLTTWRYIFVIC